MNKNCGCKADYKWLTENERRLVIVFCPLHAAAEEMLAALKTVRLADVHSLAREAIIRAIAKAESEVV